MGRPLIKVPIIVGILAAAFFGSIAFAEDPPTAPRTPPSVENDYEADGFAAEDAQAAKRLDQGTAKLAANQVKLDALPSDDPGRPTLLNENRKIAAAADRASKECPTCVATVSAAAASALQAGDKTKAQALSNQAVEVARSKLSDPRATDKIVFALNRRASILEKSGEYERAHADAQQALKIKPGDRSALAMLQMTAGRAKASSAGAGGRTQSAAGGAGPAAAQPGSGASSSPSGAPGVAMTNAGSLEARKQIALGWSRISLDAKAALKNFEAAITADPLSAAVRVQRSKARLASGDAPGALGDSDDAIRMDPSLGEAYAARAEAKRALGRAEEELLTDYEEAAKLDGRFTQAYRALVTRLTGEAPSSGAPAAAAGTAGRSAPGGIRGLLSLPPKQWGMIALLCALAAALGGVLSPLLLKKRRSSENSAPTPRP